jgi:hypothetical protein
LRRRQSRAGNAQRRSFGVRHTGGQISEAEQSRSTRIGGVLVVAYLLALLHVFRLTGTLFSRACWVRRLERRWIDLWMR